MLWPNQIQLFKKILKTNC